MRKINFCGTLFRASRTDWLVGLLFGLIVAWCAAGAGFLHPRTLCGEEFFATATDSVEGGLSPQGVRMAMEGGVEFLRRKQKPDGSWDDYTGYPTGTTGLCTLALLSAGLDPSDPTMVRALNYLRAFRFTPPQEQTYTLALQTMVLAQADPVGSRAILTRNTAWLVARQFQTNNSFRGGWSYTGLAQENSRADNSNSQFAILALYEAHRAGIAVPDGVWESARDYWLRMQNSDGSWGYTTPPGVNNRRYNSGPGTGSMTCAGIAALVMTADVAGSPNARLVGEEIRCCQPNTDANDDPVQRGLNWLAQHFSVNNNPGTARESDSWLFYYLYGLERVGRLTAHRFIGNQDWYREGADYLLRRKGRLSNYWKAGTDLRNENSLSTAFALLFLSKGRWPVLVSKLKYDSPNAPEGPEWNLHPNDLAHLTEYVELHWKRNMIWQVIDAAKASGDDYAQTPVLSISGRRSPLPSDPEKRRRFLDGLREYLEGGGFLLAEALDGDESFESGFYELVAALFPDEPDGGLALLPEDHPIWNLEKIVPPQYQRPLYGVHFGCRTSVIFLPSSKPEVSGPVAPSVAEVRPSFSCLWELAGNVRRLDRFSPPVAAEVTAALDVGENILAYATGRELKFKEEIPARLASETNRGVNEIYAAILDHGGGSACAPKAIPNLMNHLRTHLGIPVQTQVRKVRATSAQLYRSPILFQQGRSEFRYTDDEIGRLRDFFHRGGFLFANAICGSEPFTQSFWREMKRIFPDAEPVLIPRDDPVYSNRYGGYTIERLSVRRPQKTDGNRAWSAVTEEAPPLWGIAREGTWVVLFSPDDVSCALEKSGGTECRGYTPESALILSVNVLLYAIEHL